MKKPPEGGFFISDCIRTQNAGDNLLSPFEYHRLKRA